MDLETMRCKVDENLYPTYKYFLYDIEQIIFNAKEYNPLNTKDSRGRSIVSAAHNMLDVVETHAYGFKQRLGYDVFQRCEEVCLRRGMEMWKLEPCTEQRHVMPEENKIFYVAVLRVHEEVKRELGLTAATAGGGAGGADDADGRGEMDSVVKVCGGTNGSVISSTNSRDRRNRVALTCNSSSELSHSSSPVDCAGALRGGQMSERELRRMLREQAAAAEALVEDKKEDPEDVSHAAQAQAQAQTQTQTQAQTLEKEKEKEEQASGNVEQSGRYGV
jgi:hypothetical protein